MSRWVDVREAAEILGISIYTVKRRAKSGELTSRQEKTATGFKWFVEVDDLQTESQSETPKNGHVQNGELLRLEQFVAELQKDKALLWEEVEARRREVAELHILLQRAQEQVKLLGPLQQDLHDAVAGLQQSSADATAAAVAEPTRRKWWKVWEARATESPAYQGPG
jgi:hypothetical protein